MKKLTLRTILIAGLAMAALLFNQPVAHAALGDVVAAVEFDTGCDKSPGHVALGVGIAFDGTNLWFSCTPFNEQTLSNGPDLFRATTAGVVTGSWRINTTNSKGIGALAYDAGRNAIWAGWGNDYSGGPTLGNVYFISLDAGKNVVTSSVVGNVAGEAGIIVCGLDDGLAYDGLTDELYFSDDCSTTVHNYDVVPGSPPTVGPELEHFAWGGNDCYNSGLAVGGQLLYEGSNGCNHVWVVNKDTRAASFDFVTSIGEIRDEDLECDEITFANLGKEVMWSIEAYDVDYNGDGFAHRLAGAYEIPAGSCHHGGGSLARMTGGGTVGSSAVRIGFELHCLAELTPNNLQVSWGKNNKFHLESLTTATCTDDPAISENPPPAGFDTMVGHGTGRYNGQPGYTIHFKFADAGEPGTSDTAEINIYKPDSTLLISVTGNIMNGNLQAHAQ